METFCLAPAALLTFLELLSPDIVEVTSENTVVVHAEEGPVTWVYIDEIQMFAIDGKLWYCFDGEAT